VLVSVVVITTTPKKAKSTELAPETELAEP
jgi:hypothetical protein